MMSGRRALQISIALLLGLAALLYFRRESDVGARGSQRHGNETGSFPLASGSKAPSVASGQGDAPSEIARDLNAAGGDIRRDLEIASELFVAWQSNFPRDGNPVGENHEITAALVGGNRLGFAFIPRGHRAINARGELCDRWGTPFRFHQISGTHMEIRSAGADRKFATADDAVWPRE